MMEHIDAANPQRWQIRVLSGPMHGATYPIDCRLDIGRASSSDLQIVDDGVSRQHAEIIENVYGHHVLVDLDSSNGTFVSGRRIRRIKLVPGTTFEIMSMRFIYEAEPVQIKSVPAVPTVPTASDNLRSMRETNDYGTLDLPVPIASSPRTTMHWAQVESRGQQRHHVRAVDHEGVGYEGDLISDVLEFRRLLARFLRGMVRELDELQHFAALESRLRLPSQGPRGATNNNYRRFSCYLPGCVRFAKGGSILGVVLDFGVDGAQILSKHHGLSVGSAVWLSLDLVHGGHPKKVVFTSRVLHSKANHIGLGFAGEPVQNAEDCAVARKATKRDLSEHSRALQADRALIAGHRNRPAKL